jgi:hypothetical protein
MKQKLVRNWLVAGTLVAVQGLSAPAQNGPTTSPAPAERATQQTASSPAMKPATAKAGQSDPSEPGVKSNAQQPTGVDEILKLLQAGVSKEVMKAYIETTPVAFPLSAIDLVTLKEHGLPDELTVALIKRGAELTAQVNQASASNAAPAKVSGTASLNELLAAFRSGRLNSGYLDPEGYDYFRYYYLYPRTLASANQRLFSSPTFPASPAWSPGYYSPWAFHPRPFAP